eukprot:1325691-Karenia_brevis.AAC.1
MPSLEPSLAISVEQKWAAGYCLKMTAHLKELSCVPAANGLCFSDPRPGCDLYIVGEIVRR